MPFAMPPPIIILRSIDTKMPELPFLIALSTIKRGRRMQTTFIMLFSDIVRNTDRDV